MSQRIYELSQEVLEFRRAAAPLTGILAAITAGFDKYGVDEELRSYLRDVADHVTQVNEPPRSTSGRRPSGCSCATS